MTVSAGSSLACFVGIKKNRARNVVESNRGDIFGTPDLAGRDQFMLTALICKPAPRWSRAGQAIHVATACIVPPRCADPPRRQSGRANGPHGRTRRGEALPARRTHAVTMNLRGLAVAFVCWELLDFVLQRLFIACTSTARFRQAVPDAKHRTAFTAGSPAYAKSTVHAMLVAVRGWHHLFVLWDAPPAAKLQLLPATHAAYHGGPRWLPESEAILVTNIILAAYLLSDGLHVLAAYPALGGADTIAHHVAFFVCAILAGWYQMAPFVFAWLIIGESSTPFLNVRWALIKTGNGAHWVFSYVERLFVFWFVFTRLGIYGAGLSHFCWMLWRGGPVLRPMWTMAGVLALVFTGFALNMVWLAKIASVFARSEERHEKAAKVEPDGPVESASAEERAAEASESKGAVETKVL